MNYLKQNKKQIFTIQQHSDNFIIVNDGVNVGPIFGVQKTYNNNLQIGLSFGLGYRSVTENESSIDAIGNFNFSYVILPKGCVLNNCPISKMDKNLSNYSGSIIYK